MSRTARLMRRSSRTRSTSGVVCLTLAVLSSAQAELVSHWRLDGDARDAKGRNHGTLHGDPVWVPDRHGGPDKALKLDGKDDYVDCGNDESLCFTDGKSDRPFSISVWVKLDPDQRLLGLFSKGSEYAAFCNSLFRFRLTDSRRGGHRTNSTGAIGGDWTHLAVTYDGSGAPGAVVGYIDGGRGWSPESTDPYQSMTPSDAALRMGTGPFGSMGGVIDDFRVFDHVLTDAEIKNLADLWYDGLTVRWQDVKMRKRADQVVAEIPVALTNLATLPRKADMRAALSTLPREPGTADLTVAIERDGLLLEPGTHTRTITIPVTAGGCWEFSLEVNDPEGGRGVSRRTLPLMLEYRPLRVEVLQPCYMNAIFAGQKLDALVLEVDTDLEPARRTEHVFEFLLRAGERIVARASQPMMKDRSVVRVPLPDLEDGRYGMEGRLVHKPSGQVVGQWLEDLRKLPPREGEVRFDENGVCLVDNQPFVPFGTWSSQWWPKGIWDTMAYGCNAICSPAVGSPESLDVNGVNRPYLNVLRREGIKLLIRRGWPMPISDENNQDVLRTGIRQTKSHPAVLGWYTGNEPKPESRGPLAMRLVRKLINEEDPYHPTTIANHHQQDIPVYVDAMDVASPDPYPRFRGDGWLAPMSPTTAVEKVLDASRGRKPVWVVLQAHDMSLFGLSNSRSPTFSDLRAQLYQAVAAGAKGFWWYCLHWIEPDVEIGLTYLAQEVKTLRDAILAPQSPHAFALVGEEADLALARREVRDEVYLLAVNASRKPRELRFRAAEIADARLQVVGEARSVEVRGGEFTDAFEPWDTHIYTTDEHVARQISLATVGRRIDALRNPPVKRGNLAWKGLGTKVEPSQELGRVCPPPEYMIDGSDISSWDNSHSWRKPESPFPQWVDVVFTKPQKASRVLVDSNASHLQIQVPDKDAWATIAEAKSARNDVRREVQTIGFPQVETQRLRVLVRAVKGWKDAEDWTVQIWEMEVYDE